MIIAFPNSLCLNTYQIYRATSYLSLQHHGQGLSTNMKLCLTLKDCIRKIRNQKRMLITSINVFAVTLVKFIYTICKHIAKRYKIRKRMSKTYFKILNVIIYLLEIFQRYMQLVMICSAF